MLNYFLENRLIRYSEREIDDWKEAIVESCQTLLEKGIINQSYIDEMIVCVEKYGPYIIIVPDVAMPHSSEQSEGVFGTAISFTKLKKAVLFDDSDEEKRAILFFTLAAKNPAEHLENIQHLSELLMEEGLVEDLIDTQSIADYLLVVNKYSN